MRVTCPLLLGPYYYVVSYVTTNISVASVQLLKTDRVGFGQSYVIHRLHCFSLDRKFVSISTKVTAGNYCLSGYECKLRLGFCVLYFLSILSYFQSLETRTTDAHTPARTLFLTGLKSRVLKLPFFT